MKKRLISILLSFVLILSAVSGAAVFSGDAILYGDTDNDGEVSIIDATLIQRALVGLKELDEAAVIRGDVSGSDGLDVTDATLIQRYDARMIDRFPVEKGQGEEVTKVKNDITIEFTNNKGWTPVNAYFYNYATGEAMQEWPGIELTDPTLNDSGEQVFRTTVDVSRYDRVVFNSGSKQSTEIPVTKASNGFSIEGRVGKKYYANIYTFNDTKGTMKTVKMAYNVIPGVNKKKVYIWVPEGYDAADTSKKYSVLYMCDGHNLFGTVPNLSGYYWQCQDTVNSLMQNGGDGVIVVGIDNNDDNRVRELTPNLDSLDPMISPELLLDEDGAPYFNCEAFSDFIVDSVIPYIESNYNVNSVRGIAGSSCGGQAAFYIGMEHPEIFSYIGAYSSAFAYFSNEIWDKYLGDKDFSGNVPRIYFYCGMNPNDDTEQWIYPMATAMYDRLVKLGYPEDRMVNIIDEDARHHESYWALYFPEMLSWGLDL